MKPTHYRGVAPKQSLRHKGHELIGPRPRLIMNACVRALLATLTLLGSLSPTLHAASRDAEWKKVDEAMNKGYGEAAKAIARKIVLEGTIQGNKPEEKITRMETAMALAPKEIVPLLQT